MPVRKTIPFSTGIFFITFTCYRWLPLIEKTTGYDIVYDWFNLLKAGGHFVNGFVIIPNHVHVLLGFTNTTQSINTLIGNGKRFMAYAILERLVANKEDQLLSFLATSVNATRRRRNKQHEVWNLSFDWKDCRTNAFMLQKLNYMHNTPCSGRWQLCNNAIEYQHSSAQFYHTGEQGYYPVTNYLDMQDIVFRSNKGLAN